MSNIHKMFLRSYESARTPPIEENIALGRRRSETRIEMEVRDIVLFEACICSIADMEATYVNLEVKYKIDVSKTEKGKYTSEIYEDVKTHHSPWC